MSGRGLSHCSKDKDLWNNKKRGKIIGGPQILFHNLRGDFPHNNNMVNTTSHASFIHVIIFIRAIEQSY